MAKKEKVKVPKAEGEKSNLLKIVIIVFLGLILIAGSVFGGFMIASKNSSYQGSPNVRQIQRKNLVVYPLETFTVNLADEGGKRYVKAKISLGYEKNDKLAEELQANKDIVASSIVSVIRSKKAEEIGSTYEKTLKDNIKSKVNSVLINGQIEEVYLVEILIQ